MGEHAQGGTRTVADPEGPSLPEPRTRTPGRLRRLVINHLAEPQHRNAYYLMANTVTGAAVGVLFWLLLARVAGLPPAEVGLGYSLVALGTIVGLVAKGGLDTALLRSVPGASREEGNRLLRFAMFVGTTVALGLALLLAASSTVTGLFRDVTAEGWLLVAAIGLLLVVTWLQDAHFLAEGDARGSFQRNLVFSAARLVLPLPIVALALAQPVALAWALALAASALAAAALAQALPAHPGRAVPRRPFLLSAWRNVSGSTAEFLPGLLLAPMVLAIDGPEAAAYFGIAWTAASLLFLASAAVSRSALAQMVRSGPAGESQAIRRALRQHLAIVAPAAVAVILAGPPLLALFGPGYAREGGPVLALLAASVVVVSPSYLYLALLRAHERPLPLVAFPAAMVVLLGVLAPLLDARLGAPGVALAWCAANLPFALYATWRLRLAVKGVSAPGAAPLVGGAPYVE